MGKDISIIKVYAVENEGDIPMIETFSSTEDEKINFYIDERDNLFISREGDTEAFYAKGVWKRVSVGY